MAVAPNVKLFIEGLGVPYEVLIHPRAETPLGAAAAAYVAPEQVVQADLLKDRRGLLLVVYPASHNLDIESLNRQLDRDLRPADKNDRLNAFPDCEPGAVPPVGEPYGIKTIVDDGFADSSELYFPAGGHTELIRLSGRDLRRVLAAAWHGSRIARPSPELANQAARDNREHRRRRIRERIENIRDLPAMPEMAARILQLRANPYAGVRDLARILEHDPSLAAQVIRYAQSPLFGYGVTVTSVHDAINRVLGYDMVMNVALGIATGRSFRNPVDGPLGLRAFWRHATHCAALVQTLGKMLPPDKQPRPGLAYLAGLLHNFGFLVLGHLFQPEFFWLNKTVAERLHVPITQIETDMLGVTHTELGAWLMEAWRMPGEVVAAVRRHHDEDYVDLHAVYANLVLVANRLLKEQGIGDASDGELPLGLLSELQISPDQARMALDNVLQGQQALDGMANQMAA
jgi:HD-like signal output (HDOD) protein/prolyl-tRNA editing enzyme YbaK/EbsC (Cys-tRNA(Pro) deacylase)